ncbi:MAG: hypothetical protein V1882_05290 [Candidatus Omnitrophota bacterium]
MRRMTAGLIAFMFPLMLGTTYIVRENGKEVGTWVEKDGSDVTRYIDNTVTKTGSQAIAEQQIVTSGRAKVSDEQERIEGEKYMEREETFGIREGLTRAQLENISMEKGLLRKTKYSDNDTSTGEGFWIFEYVTETKHYKHLFKVYLESNYWTVKKVFHSVEER